MKTVGKEIRMGRFLPDKQNAVITALDHAPEMGPIPGLIDLAKTVESVAASDGILVNAETLASYKHVFAKRNSPSLLVRVTWTTAYCFDWGYDQAHSSLIMPVQEALALGADMIIASCVLQSGDQAVDRDNLRLFCEISKAANDCGIPLVGEAYPLGADFMSTKELHKKIRDSVRVLWELGADLIKTFYTGPDFAEVVECVEAPVMVLGAAKKDSELAALEMVEQAIRSGARGVAFGRNVFQSKSPKDFLKALKDVTNKKSSALEAADKYGIN